MELFGLVLDADDGLVVAGLDCGVGDARLFHQQDDAGTAGCGYGTLDAEILYLVIGVADAGGVDKAEGDAAKLDGVFDGIAGGALYVGDDGSFFTEKGVEQGALAYVRCSDDGYGDAILQGVASLEGVGQMGDVSVYLMRQMEQFAAVGKLEVFVVGEIEFQLEQRGEFEQLFAHDCQLRGDAAAQLAHGQMVGGAVGRGYEVGHGLCL